MKVMICGAGQVGFNIARYLASEGNDVTIIDIDPQLVREASPTSSTSRASSASPRIPTCWSRPARAMPTC